MVAALGRLGEPFEGLSKVTIDRATRLISNTYIEEMSTGRESGALRIRRVHCRGRPPSGKGRMASGDG